MKPDDNKNAKRKEFVEVAKAMLDGTVHLIEGVRSIDALRFDVGDPDADVFLLIRAVASETDRFSLGDVRNQCSPEYLLRVDEELERYLAEAKEKILSACRELVRVYFRAPLKLA